ncbi:methylaspartate ammonia-lyase [Streptomyces sp. NPDC000994]
MNAPAQPHTASAPVAVATGGRTIRDVIAAPGLGAFFFDDQAAIKAGATRDGAAYTGTALTDGYRAVREPSESVSVMLVLDDGYVAHGDCASVQYSGVGGREPRMQARAMVEAIESELAPALRGLDVSSFRTAAVRAEQLIAEVPGLGRATAYGLSQALLDAAAHAAGHHLMARVIQDEWQLTAPLAAVPVYGQSGEDRCDNVDKMILKTADVIPHGLINTAELVGPGGRELETYISWITRRIEALRPRSDYAPALHLDVYGLLGAAAESLEDLADIIIRLEAAAAPYPLRIEHPLDAGGRDAQIDQLGALRKLLAERGSMVRLIADEWANTAEDIHAFAAAGAADMVQIKTPDLGSLHHTVDAILDCKQHGVGPVLGGTCAETDRSARTCVHIGIATGVVQMLAKPGMGFDEGYAIVRNEMHRALRLDAALPA